MSDIVLTVSLKGAVLDVDDDGGVGIVAHPGVTQSIAWVLDPKTLAGCIFEPPGGDSGGFHWISTPHSNIFSTAWLSPDRTRLTLEDRHVGSSSRGPFVYMLRVRKNKSVVYSTTVQPPLSKRKGKGGKHGKSDKNGIRTTNNPVIINK